MPYLYIKGTPVGVPFLYLHENLAHVRILHTDTSDYSLFISVNLFFQSFDAGGESQKRPSEVFKGGENS